MSEDREKLAAWMMLNGFATGHSDTMRQPPSDEAVEAGQEAAYPDWCLWSDGSQETGLKTMRRALTAALAVMAGTEVKHSPLPGMPPADTPITTTDVNGRTIPVFHAGEMVTFATAGDAIRKLNDHITVLVREALVGGRRDVDKPGTPPDPKPEWTAKKEIALQASLEAINLIAWHVGKSVVADDIKAVASAAFKPEPVWPPNGCLNPTKCGGAGLCLDTHPLVDCPHAGERADG